MKTTIKCGAGRAIVVQPGPSGTVQFDVTVFGVGLGGEALTEDQAGALIFGIEQALESGQTAAQRMAQRAAA